MNLYSTYYIIPHCPTYLKILSTGEVVQIEKIECHPIQDIGYGIKICFKSHIQIEPVFTDVEIFDSNGIIFKDAVYSPNLEKTDCAVCRGSFKYDIVDKLKNRIEQSMQDIYCLGAKKNGQPCRRYLGKVEGKAELLCTICKTVNVVEDGKVAIKIKDKTEGAHGNANSKNM